MRAVISFDKSSLLRLWPFMTLPCFVCGTGGRVDLFERTQRLLLISVAVLIDMVKYVLLIGETMLLTSAKPKGKKKLGPVAY